MIMYIAEITRLPPITTLKVRDSWPNQTPNSAAKMYSIVKMIPTLVAYIKDCTQVCTMKAKALAKTAV